MAKMAAQRSNDWLSSIRTNVMAWWGPKIFILVALFAPVPPRTAVWTVALAWMGTACILNARRCGRTHCRFTGPYYLAMIIPVLALGAGVVPSDLYGWIALGTAIILGSKIIWWMSERAWGKFS